MWGGFKSFFKNLSQGKEIREDKEVNTMVAVITSLGSGKYEAKRKGHCTSANHSLTRLTTNTKRKTSDLKAEKLAILAGEKRRRICVVGKRERNVAQAMGTDHPTLPVVTYPTLALPGAQDGPTNGTGDDEKMTESGERDNPQ